ncbi:UNVERIFIED_CONTAM: hypothetical protein FKN15_021808 [Acipenser sinensis]
MAQVLEYLVRQQALPSVPASAPPLAPAPVPSRLYRRSTTSLIKTRSAHLKRKRRAEALEKKLREQKPQNKRKPDRENSASGENLGQTPSLVRQTTDHSALCGLKINQAQKIKLDTCAVISISSSVYRVSELPTTLSHVVSELNIYKCRQAGTFA